MTLTEIKGNLFSLVGKVQAISHGTNCVGSMGAGIALIFKMKYPEMFHHYRELCLKKEVEPGDCFIWKTKDGMIIYNLMVKNHWSNPSEVQWVNDSLIAMFEHARDNKITSIALPKVACGLGKLIWENDVKPLVIKHNMEIAPNTKVIVCDIV